MSFESYDSLHISRCVVYFDQQLGAAYPMLVKICFFNIFHVKSFKIEKAGNLLQNLCKKCFFKVCTRMLVEGLIPKKTPNQRFGANL